VIDVYFCCGGGEPEDDEEQDDFEEGEGLEDEEDVIVMGGDGFSPEDIAAAERRFEEVLACSLVAIVIQQFLCYLAIGLRANPPQGLGVCRKVIARHT
jgi:hypothetical protein